MIEQTTAYRVGERVFPTIQESQKAELLALLPESWHNEKDRLDIGQWLIDNTDEIVAILTCQPKARKPRADKGGSHRKRTKATAATAAPLTT